MRRPINNNHAPVRPGKEDRVLNPSEEEYWAQRARATQNTYREQMAMARSMREAKHKRRFNYLVCIVATAVVFIGYNLLRERFEDKDGNKAKETSTQNLNLNQRVLRERAELGYAWGRTSEGDLALSVAFNSDRPARLYAFAKGQSGWACLGLKLVYRQNPTNNVYYFYPKEWQGYGDQIGFFESGKVYVFLVPPESQASGSVKAEIYKLSEIDCLQ